MASLALSLLAAPDAHAGTYTWQTTNASGQITAQSPTFAGGNWFDLHYQPNGPIPYNTSSTGSGTGDSSGQYKSTGTITATFTWQPALGQTAQSDPAPACIITQTSTANFYANGFSANPKISCLDGLVAPLDPENDNASGTTYQGRSTGTRCSLGTPSSGVVTATLTGAQMSLDLSHGGQYPNVTSGVQWGVAVAPVTINLNGAIKDSTGNYNILVGQGCTASLIGIPTGTGWKTTYSWSVSGSTFQDWEPTTPAFPNASPATPANSQASFYDPGPGTQTNSTYHWYWNDMSQQTETVTCTAMVTPPAGQGSSFSVTATQNVTVYVPTLANLSNSVGMGYIRNTQQNNVTDTQMIALQPGNPPAGNGSIWTAAVSLPTTPYFGTGTWAYLQLIKAGEYLASPGQKATSKDTLKGEGLDGPFPYQGNTHSTDGRKDNDGDDPYIGGLNSTIKNAVMTSSFHTYLMFLPPANSNNDIRWVPLAVSLWTTNFNASLDPFNNSPYSAWTDYPATQSVGQVGLGYSFVPQNSFPSWTQIIDASDDPFIVQ